MDDPTWANHARVFQGIDQLSYQVRALLVQEFAGITWLIPALAVWVALK